MTVIWREKGMAIINKIYKSSTVILATYLCALGCFYLLAKLLGYSFVPLNGLALNIISVVIVVALTVGGVKSRAERTRLATTLATFLPLIAMFFLFVKWVSWYQIELQLTMRYVFRMEAVEKLSYYYVIYSIIILLCSMILFFVHAKKDDIKIRWGIISAILYILVPCISFVGFLAMFSLGFGQSTISQGTMLITLIIAFAVLLHYTTRSFFIRKRMSTLAVIYSILLFLAICVLSCIMFFSDTKYVYWSEMSPNGAYLVEVGQLGGRQYSAPGQFVDVTRQNRDINLLIGTFKKDTQRIHVGGYESVFIGNYGEPVTILWETEEIFYVDGRETKYVIPAK